MMMGEVNHYEPSKMMALFGDVVCLNKNIQKNRFLLQSSVDFKNSEFEELNSLNTGIFKRVEHGSSEQMMNRSSSMKTQVYDVGAGASFSGFGVGVSGSVSKIDKEKQHQLRESFESHTERYQTVYCDSVKKAYNIKPQKLALDQKIKERFLQLYHSYSKQRNSKKQLSAQLQEQLVKFKHEYGTHIETGKYSFGTKYILNEHFSFNLANNGHQNTSYMQKSLLTAAKASYGGLFGAEGHLNRTKENENSNEERDKKWKYNLDVTILANPPTADFANWSKVVENNMDYWQLLEKHVKLVGIGSVMMNPLNTFQGFQAWYFEEFCELFDKKYGVLEEQQGSFKQEIQQKYEQKFKLLQKEYKESKRQLERRNNQFKQKTIQAVQAISYRVSSIRFSGVQGRFISDISDVLNNLVRVLKSDEILQLRGQDQIRLIKK